MPKWQQLQVVFVRQIKLSVGFSMINKIDENITCGWRDKWS